MDECMVCHETLGPFVILEEVGSERKRKACLSCFGEEGDDVPMEGTVFIPHDQEPFDMEKATPEQKAKKTVELAAATLVSLINLTSGMKSRGMMTPEMVDGLNATMYSNLLNIAHLAGFSRKQFHQELQKMADLSEKEVAALDALRNFNPTGEPS